MHNQSGLLLILKHPDLPRVLLGSCLVTAAFLVQEFSFIINASPVFAEDRPTPNASINESPLLSPAPLPTILTPTVSEVPSVSPIPTSSPSATPTQYEVVREAEEVLTTLVAAREEKKAQIERYFNRVGAPLANYAETFVQVSEDYGLDYRLLPAIATIESGGGRRIPSGSFNAWGWAIYTGRSSGASFGSWENGIRTVGLGIRNGYIRQGLTTPELMNRKYAADQTWASKVRREMNKLSIN